MSATITTRAAALALHLSHRQVRTLISTGQLPARITPRGYRISPLDLPMVAAGVRRGRGRPRRPSVDDWKPATVGCHWTKGEYTITTYQVHGGESGYALYRHGAGEIGRYQTFEQAAAAI